MVSEILKPIPPDIQRSDGAIDGIRSGVVMVNQKLQELDMRASLIIPPDLQGAWKRYCHLRNRVLEGDFRYRDSELKALKEIAQWSLDMVKMLRGQEPQEVDL